GDFGGGTMYLVVGVLAALFESQRSGRGQVIDCAIVDGAASLLTFIHAALAHGSWHDRRGNNLLDGGAPFYTTYACAGGGYIAVGALEPQFHDVLIRKLGLDPEAFKDRLDPESWPRLLNVLQETFAQRTRREWCDLLEGSDACFAPVLPLGAVASHPHMAAPRVVASLDGVTCRVPAPPWPRGAWPCSPRRRRVRRGRRGRTPRNASGSRLRLRCRLRRSEKPHPDSCRSADRTPRAHRRTWSRGRRTSSRRQRIPRR